MKEARPNHFVACHHMLENAEPMDVYGDKSVKAPARAENKN